MEIGEALVEHGDAIMSVPGVVGVGETEVDGEPAVMVMVAEDSPAVRAALPETVAGYPVVIDVTGEIMAFPAAGDIGDIGDIDAE